jgi:two-component system response regulator HydG
VIALSGQNLEHRVQGGIFNAELFAKLQPALIRMPPLKDRKDDFRDIVDALILEIAHETHRGFVKGISPDAYSSLESYEWPGNIRELRNVLRLAILQAKSSIIEKSELPAFGQDRLDFRATREEFEKIYYLELLRTHQWNLVKVAQVLKLDVKILEKKITQYGISKP